MKNFNNTVCLKKTLTAEKYWMQQICSLYRVKEEDRQHNPSVQEQVVELKLGTKSLQKFEYLTEDSIIKYKGEQTK